MKLIFKKITIENFLSIGNAELELNNNGYVFVKGINQNEDDNAISNGAGKSTIFEAISWVLTGETIRGCSKNVVNIFGNGTCKVKLTLNIDGDEYIIERGIE